MTLLWTLPWPTVALILVGGLAMCYFGWKSSRSGRGRPGIKWSRRAAMIVLLAITLATPGAVAYVDKSGTNATVYFVVDTTGSMAAQDYNGKEPRLEGVRADIVEISRALTGARFSIIEYSSTSVQTLPLTTDLRAVASWADVIDREVTSFSVGSSINRPVDTLERVLSTAAQDRPQDVRIVVFMSDGENTDSGSDSKRDIEPAFGKIKQYVDAGVVLGYGTAQGGKMVRRQAYVADDPKDFIMDPATQQPAVSKYNEANLQMIADQLGVGFQHRTAPGGAADNLKNIDVETIALEHAEGKKVYNPVHWPWAVGIALLLGWEVISLVPRIRAVAAAVRGPHVAGRKR